MQVGVVSVKSHEFSSELAGIRGHTTYNLLHAAQVAELSKSLRRSHPFVVYFDFPTGSLPLPLRESLQVVNGL